MTRKRPIGFADAKRLFVHRYTLEHVPAWATVPHVSPLYGPVYFAPHYASDREWYDRTEFHGEGEIADKRHCYSAGQTWPLGKGFLAKPYQPGQPARVAFETV